MPATKISADPELTAANLAAGDYLPIVDASEAAATANKRITASSLRAFVQGAGALTKPLVADFTRIDANGIYTLSDTDQGIRIVSASAAQGDKPCMIAKAVGSTFTATCRVSGVLRRSAFNAVGMAIRDSASGRITATVIGHDSASWEQRWNSVASWSSNQATQAVLEEWLRDGLFMRLVSDGTTVSFQVGYDGVDFVTVATFTRTAWTAAPDQVGVWFHTQAAGSGMMKITHWALA